MSELKKTGSETNIATSVDVSNAVSGVAHLSGNETFTGTKTFNNTIYVGDGSSTNMMLTSGDIRKMTGGTVKTYSFPPSAGTLELQGHTHNELDAYYTKLLVVDDGTGGLITRENVEKGFKLGPISVTDPSNNSLHLEITIGIPIKVSQFSNDDSLYSTGSIWLQIRDVDNSVDIVSWQEAAIDHTKDNAGKNFFLSSGITINPYYSFPQYDWSEYLQTAPFTITKNNDNTFYFTESWGPISTYQNNLQSETWITNTSEQIETVNDVDGKLGAYAKNNHTHTNITWDTIQTTAYLDSISDNAGMDTPDVYGINLESSAGKPAISIGRQSSACNLSISIRSDDGISLIRKNLSDRRIYKYDGIHDVAYGTYGHDFALQFPAITANETIATLSDINSIDGFVPYANSSLKSVVLGSGVSTGTGSLALVSANALGNGSIAMGTSAVSAYGSYTIAMGAGATMTSGTMGTFAHGNSVSAIGRGCHAEGRATIAGGTVTTFAAHSEGWNTSAFANYSHAEGVHVGIPSADKFAYAWNGVSAASASGGYSSHGEGTFNINPSGGLDGFYIGDTPLSTTLATYQTTAGMSNYQPVSAMAGYVNTTSAQSISGIKKFNSIYVGSEPISVVTGNIDEAPGFAAVMDGPTSYYAQFVDESGGYVYVYYDDCGQFYYKPANQAEVILNLPKTNGTLATQQWVSGNYALASAIAPAYDSTKTYSVGDTVTTSGSLWKCTTAVTTAEAFDSTKWQNVSLLREMLCDIVYPVGSIYTSVNSTSPAALFGGTWERITGCFLLAATDNGESGASQAAGNTGGSATHTLTAAQLPKITGSFRLSDNNVLDTPSSSGVREGSGALSIASVTHPQRQSTHSAGLSAPTTAHVTKVNLSFGSGTAHNNMPPYLAVYVWKRTA